MLTERNAFLLHAAFACQLISFRNTECYLDCQVHFRPFNFHSRKPSQFGLTGFINLFGHLFGNKINTLKEQADIQN